MNTPNKILLAISLTTMSLMAADYSQMTMDELNALRGTIAVEERDAFRAEMQSRLLAMTPEERATYMADRGKPQGQGIRDGSGAGRMNKGGEYQGQGIGQRLRDGSGAGSMGKNAKQGNRKKQPL